MKSIISFLTICIFSLFGLFSFGQLIKPFTQRTSPLNPGVTIYNLHGDFTMVGNTNLTLQNYGDNTGNSNTMVYVDVDNDSSTLNSSSATLQFESENGSNPACSEVVYAGLYWTGRSHDGANSPNTFSVTKNGVTVNYDKQIVKLMGPSSTSYTNITATSTDIYYPQGSEGLMYSSYAEITDYVQNNGVQGVYTVADIALSEGFGGSTGFYGGWGMIVIYGNSSMNLRDITVFDGHAYVAGGVTADFTIPLNGFNSAQSGPVNVKMGMIAGEGDRNISGDYFQIRNASNTAWVGLNHNGNATNNFFNSSVFTGGNVRNPNLLNNTGLDICTFEIPNQGNSVIGNNQTSTTFRYGTTQDTYVIFSIIFGVDAYEPEIAGVNSLESINNAPVSTPPTVSPGQNLNYTLDVLNTGNEPIANGQVVIPIPYNANFESAIGQYFFTPNSASTPYFDPSLGSNGSIVWNVGDLPMPAAPNTVLAQLVYSLSATEDCLLLSNENCGNNIEVNGTITGIGAVTSTSLSEAFISGFQQSGQCSGLPITAPLTVAIDAAEFVVANCNGIQDAYSFVFCGLDTTAATLPTSQISGSFPVGTRFFDSNPVTTNSVEYTNTGFPIVFGTETYYAYPEGTDVPCFFEFTITMIDSALTTVPSAQDYLYCLNENPLPLQATPSTPGNYVIYYESFPGGLSSGQITPSTSTPGVTTYYAVEALSNNCISANATPIDVIVFGNSLSTLSGINGSSVYSITTTPNNEVCFEVVSNNTDTNQVINITYNNGIQGASFQTTNDQFPIGTFCWTPDASDAGSTSFQLTITDECGEPQVFTYEIFVETNPCDVQVSLESYSNLLCSSNDGTAFVNAAGGAAPYVFTLINTVSGEIFTNDTGIFTTLTAGDYSLVVSDANNCQPVCTDLGFSITGGVEQISADVASTDLLCANGNAGGTISVTASGGTPSYLYSIGGVFVSNNTFNGLAAGTYDVTVMDVNGCSVTQQTSISAPSELVATLEDIQQALCGQNNGSLIISVSGGTAPYQISLNGNSSNTGLVGNLSAGNYTLEVIDANNCTTSTSATIASPSPLLASISNIQQPNCTVSSGSFSVAASGGTLPYSYSIGTESNQSGLFLNQPSGQYSVVVTDATGCTTTSTVTLSAPSPLVATLADVVTPSCGTSNGSVSVDVTSGTSPFVFELNGASNNSGIFNGLQSGSYEIVVSDANQCADTVSVTLNGTPSFVLSSTQTNPSCFGSCDGTINVVGSTQGMQYAWSNGAQGTSITGLCAGEYSVSATDANGCVQSLNISIVSPAPLSLTVVSTTDESCVQNDGVVVLSANGGTSPFTFFLAGTSQSNVISNSTGTFSGLSSGGYAYYAIDANGCELECIELLFIDDDCSSNTGSKNAVSNANQSPYLLMTLINNSGSELLINYSGGNESTVLLSFIDQSGVEVLSKSLSAQRGNITMKKAEIPNNAVFVLLRSANGKTLATAKVKK
jgi:hypothetical protein